MILTREQVEHTLNELVDDKVDGVRAAALLDHDAALREQLAQVEQELERTKFTMVSDYEMDMNDQIRKRKAVEQSMDEWKRAWFSLDHDDRQKLTAKDARIAQLEQEVAKANQIIADLVPLAPITEADVQWAQEQLANVKERP